MNSHQQQALNTLLSFTKLSRAVACVLVATYVIQLVAPASRQYTALVAGRFIPCAWSVFTAGILETHLLKVTTLKSLLHCDQNSHYQGFDLLAMYCSCPFARCRSLLMWQAF